MVRKHYQIPITSLYNKNYSNLIAAGRIISASGDGWEVTRVIPVCALTGQAAGLIAAINKDGINNINYIELANKLKDNKVLFV